MFFVRSQYVEAWTNLATLYLCKQNIEVRLTNIAKKHLKLNLTNTVF